MSFIAAFEINFISNSKISDTKILLQTKVVAKKIFWHFMKDLSSRDSRLKEPHQLCNLKVQVY